MFDEQNRILKAQREEWISARAIHETQVSEWWDRVQGLDPTILEQLDIPMDKISFKSLVPEAYVDKPDVNTYLKQIEEANNMFNRVNQYGVKINEEANKCLLQYQEMNSSAK